MPRLDDWYATTYERWFGRFRARLFRQLTGHWGYELTERANDGDYYAGKGTGFRGADAAAEEAENTALALDTERAAGCLTGRGDRTFDENRP